jgi:hypothetical protein
MRRTSKVIPPALALLCWTALAASAQELPRIADIRVGAHASFDRVVFELTEEGPATYGFDGSTFVLELGARPLLERQLLTTGLKRMGPLQIDATELGTRVRAKSASERVRGFRLEDPPRIVIDFGDPGPEPFELGPGLVPIVELAPSGAGAAPSPPEPEPEPKPEPTVAEAPPAPAPPAEAIAEEAPPVGEPIASGEAAPPESPEEPRPEAETQPAAEPRPAAEPAPPPTEPESASPPPAPQPVPLPEPTLRADAEPSTPSDPAARFFRRLADGSRIEVALWFAVPFLAAAFLIWVIGRVRERRLLARAAAQGGDVRAAESITPREILEATERIDVLEKRIDEEVRGRMQLEERASRIQEDLKVVQDRILRLAGRGARPK